MIKNCPSFKQCLGIAVSVFSFTLLPRLAYAAAPDGSGPWADSVFSTAQGLRKDGTAVPAIRSDASSALGVAENDTVEGHFYSLGFGGTIVLKFDNTQSGGVVVVEATNGGYPTEKASVEVSENGTTWVTAGNVSQDGQVNVPSNVCVQYVRLKDTSNTADFSDGTADGYDVDGVQLTGSACKPKNTDGNGGDTTVIINKSTTCTITQSNTTGVVNSQSSTSTTGNNTIKKTTSGTNKIKTGKAKTKNTVTVQSGSNTLINPCCCGGGDITVTVGGNGGSASDPQSGCSQPVVS